MLSQEPREPWAPEVPIELEDDDEEIADHAVDEVEGASSASDDEDDEDGEGPQVDEKLAEKIKVGAGCCEVSHRAARRCVHKLHMTLASLEGRC